MAVGIVIGVSQTSSSDCNQGFSCIGSGLADAEEDWTNALLYGVGLGVVGAVVGNAIGSAKIIIPIKAKLIFSEQIKLK